jgi:hypothetical protein
MRFIWRAACWAQSVPAVSQAASVSALSCLRNPTANAGGLIVAGERPRRPVAVRLVWDDFAEPNDEARVVPTEDDGRAGGGESCRLACAAA